MPPSSLFFSIVLPTFNRAHIVPRAIESVLGQTCTDWELIIVDDGSTDDTRTLVSPYLADERITYSPDTNQGAARARNRGIALSRGAFITFLDSDDEYLPDHLELRRSKLAAGDIDLMHGGLEVIGDDSVADMFDNTKRIPISQCFVGGTFFLKRELAEKLGGFRDLPYGDDSDLAQRAIEAGAHVLKVDWPTYRYYRDQPDSLCSIAERSGVEGILAYRKSSITSNG
ncbi:MAG TPA: glycosyltransferase family A protein [Candidatus Kapabacteria bacterium]|nr:glycosyltransferase family A protein [Candidatus Kapabacteria bacterium]